MLADLRPLPLFATAWGVLLDFVYPPRCGGCDRRGSPFCEQCRHSVIPVNARLDPSTLELIISAGLFQGPLRNAIHNLKYSGDRSLVRPLALLISDTLATEDAAELDGDSLVLVPVPLHPARRKERGFNQSELIALELSKITGWPVEKGLVRSRNTRSQVGLHPEERLANVRDAFAWEGGAVPARLLLIDDVCTTGATLGQCAEVLMHAGAQQLYAATVARAVSGGIANWQL